MRLRLLALLMIWLTAPAAMATTCGIDPWTASSAAYQEALHNQNAKEAKRP